GGGPIRRVCEVVSTSGVPIQKCTSVMDTNLPNTPQCVLCKMHPKTPKGYTTHLREHHDTTLLKSEIYLMCSCGHRFGSEHSQKKQNKKCNGRQFTLHKLDDN
ncbi:hypothetical protein PMAYCL1PPCAC_13983, partial [Pristionchus mayeri]